MILHGLSLQDTLHIHLLSWYTVERRAARSERSNCTIDHLAVGHVGYLERRTTDLWSKKNIAMSAGRESWYLSEYAKMAAGFVQISTVKARWTIWCNESYCCRKKLCPVKVWGRGGKEEEKRRKEEKRKELRQIKGIVQLCTGYDISSYHYGILSALSIHR